MWVMVESAVVALKIEGMPGRSSFLGAFPDITLNSLFVKQN